MSVGEAIFFVIASGTLAGWLSARIRHGSDTGILLDFAIGIAGGTLGDRLVHSASATPGLFASVCGIIAGAIALSLLGTLRGGASRRSIWKFNAATAAGNAHTPDAPASFSDGNVA